MSTLIKRGLLSRGWKAYQLMHLNRSVAAIREDGSCTVYAPAFMPYNLKSKLWVLLYGMP